jgi:hypothetical protein
VGVATSERADAVCPRCAGLTRGIGGRERGFQRANQFQAASAPEAAVKRPKMHCQETLIRVSLLMLLGVAADIAIAGRAMPEERLPIALDMSTVRLDAWLSARAELMVNSTRAYETFNPIGKDEDRRCVSIVNETGTPTDGYSGFDGKRVIVTGFALRYDDLPVGDTFADQTFMRRFYHGKQVHDFCNRPWVFVANKIELKG